MLVSDTKNVIITIKKTKGRFYYRDTYTLRTKMGIRTIYKIRKGI